MGGVFDRACWHLFMCTHTFGRETRVCGSAACRWGAVAIVTPPGVYPTSVGSARVEDHARSRGVWQHRRTVAESTVGGKWYSLAGPVIITPNTEQHRGMGRSRQNPNGKRAGLVFEVLVNSPKVDLAVKHRLFLWYCKEEENLWSGSHWRGDSN